MQPKMKLAIFTGVLTVFLAIGAFLAIMSSLDDTVKCNGMESTGSSCAQLVDGRIKVTSHADLLAHQQLVDRIVVGITGGLTVVFGAMTIALAIAAKRQAKREETATASWAEPVA